MEKVSAKVIEEDGKHFLVIEKADEDIKIPLSEDKPNDIKSAFNKLIIWIKLGIFHIEMEDVGPDLFSQVAQEYIAQLNREIQEIRDEMDELGLLEIESE